MSDALLSAAAEIRRQLTDKVQAIKALPEMAEVLTLQRTLNGIEEIMKQAPTSLASVFGLEATAEAVGPRFGLAEFYGLEPLDAAKKYLKAMREARPFAEIVNAIRQHGGKVLNEAELRTSLSRSTYEVAKVSDDVYGLLEFYPHIQRGGKKRAAAAPGAAQEGGEDEQAPAEEAASASSEEKEVKEG